MPAKLGEERVPERRKVDEDRGRALRELSLEDRKRLHCEELERIDAKLREARAREKGPEGVGEGSEILRVALGERER